MEYKIEDLDISEKKFKTEDLLNVDDIFSEPLSTRVGERKIRNGIVKLTPEQAALLLTKNPNNRQVKEANVAFLVKEIREGRWELNGEPIIIDSNGHIVDGQHRLWACVESEMTISTLIVYGVSPNVINTIDTGTKRIAKDCLDMHNVTNSSLAASAIKLINQFERGTYSDVGSYSRVMSNQQVIQFYYDNQSKLENSISIANNLYKKCNKIVSTGIIAGLHFLFDKKSKSQAEEFFNKLCTGIGLEEGSPITALKNKLTREAVDGNKTMSQKDKVQFIIFAWNKFRSGETCKLIKIPQDTKLSIQ